ERPVSFDVLRHRRMPPYQDEIILPGRTLWIPRNRQGPSINGPFLSRTLYLLHRLYADAHHQNSRPDIGTDRSGRSLKLARPIRSGFTVPNEGTACDAHTNRSTRPGRHEESPCRGFANWFRQMPSNPELIVAISLVDPPQAFDEPIGNTSGRF